MQPARWIRRLPWSIVALSAGLMLVGWLGIARSEEFAGTSGRFFERQLLWSALCLAAMLLASIPSYRILARWSYAALAGSYHEAVVSGWSQFRAEDLEHAEALAQKALALDPATTRAYRVLAQINLYRKRYDLSLAQVDRALEINPSDTENYSYRGAFLAWAGKPAEALPWLEGALRFDQANGFTAARLCMAYYLLRRYTEAVDAGVRALSRNPGRRVSTRQG